MKVFISSLMKDYEGFRAVAARAIRAAGHEPVLIEPPTARSMTPRSACLEKVSSSDVVIFLLGEKYGCKQASGLSAVHEEWDEAFARGKLLLAFREKLTGCRKVHETDQAKFLKIVGGWDKGRLWAEYETESDLAIEVVAALRELDAAPVQCLWLPPSCREYIGLLREKEPTLASRLTGFLADPLAKKPGHLLESTNKPAHAWISGCEHPEAWEAIGAFLDAYDLPDDDVVWEKAIESNSPRSDLHLARRACKASALGETRQAAGFLARMNESHLLHSVVKARLADDLEAVIEAVVVGQLDKNEDPAIIRLSVWQAAVAYSELDRPEQALGTLRRAREQIADDPCLLIFQAKMLMAIAEQRGITASTGRRDLLEAAELAGRARDQFREWNGPSSHAVAFVAQLLMLAGELQEAEAMCRPGPSGYATVRESESLEVRSALVDVLLRLGGDIDVPLEKFGMATVEGAVRAAQTSAANGNTKEAAANARLAISRAKQQPDPDHSYIKAALVCLAACGEAADVEMEVLANEDRSFIQAVAALHSEPPDTERAIALLEPLQAVSVAHVGGLASALYGREDIAGAVKVLLMGAERFSDPDLLVCAGEMLTCRQDSTDTQMEEAIRLAGKALTHNPSSDTRKRVWQLLMTVAKRRSDWKSLEVSARAMAHDLPNDPVAVWAEIYALHQQGRNDVAWSHIVARDLSPHDPDSAILVHNVASECARVTESDIQRLQEIIGMCPKNERLVGSIATTSLLASSNDQPFSSESAEYIHDMAADFTTMYPNNSQMQMISTGTSDEREAAKWIADWLGEITHHRTTAWGPLVGRVRYGQVPYGLLQILQAESYTQSLLDAAAGFITAISADPNQRAKERVVVKAALDGIITIDTSVVAVCLRTDTDVRKCAEVFSDVLVADGLIYDARRAKSATSKTAHSNVMGTVSYDPIKKIPSLTLVDKGRLEREQQLAVRATEILGGWQPVMTGALPRASEFLDLLPDEVDGVWTSSLRVAKEHDCPLWSDDLALRVLAEDAGIPSFSTWALAEVLNESGDIKGLPDMEELGTAMLRAQIADVPFSLSKLDEITEDPNDPAFGAVLARPLAWREDHQMATFKWFSDRIVETIRSEQHYEIANLLKVATFGLGAVSALSDPTEMTDQTGGLLAEIVLRTRFCAWNEGVSLPEDIAKRFIAASRFAVHGLGGEEQHDPLPSAVRHLAHKLESDQMVAQGQVSPFIFAMLEGADPEDVRIIVEALLAEDRV